MTRYAVADFSLEIIFSFLTALTWFFLIVSIYKSEEHPQRKNSKLRIAYLLMTAALANLGAYVCFYKWSFDVRDMYTAIIPK